MRKIQKITLPNGLGLSVSVWGESIKLPPNSPTVLLIHGTGDASCVWVDVVDSLIPDHKVIGVDLRGHGDSDWAPDRDYSSKAMVGDLVSLAEKLCLENLIVIGHSWGGEIALRFAVTRRLLVHSVVLVDFGPEGDECNVAQARSAIRSAHRLYRNVDEYIEVLEGRHPLASPALLFQVANETTRSVGTGGIMLKYDPAIFDTSVSCSDEIVEDCGPKEVWRLLSVLDRPTLIVRGIASSILSQRVAKRMAYDFLPNGALSVIPVAGHSVQLDNPDEFKKVIQRFCRSGCDFLSTAGENS